MKRSAKRSLANGRFAVTSLRQSQQPPYQPQWYWGARTAESEGRSGAGFGGHRRHRSPRGPGRHTKAGRILHRLWFNNMSVASTTALAAQGQPQGPQSHASWFIIAVIWASSASCLAKISCR